MTIPIRPPGLRQVIQDHHTRIRRLEGSPGGGSSGTCPDCVLDPYTVNPGDLFVPEPYRNCISVAPFLIEQETPACGTTGPITVIPSTPIGSYCASYAIVGPALQLQARVKAVMDPNIQNLIVYAGKCSGGLSQELVRVWDAPFTSPPLYDSGWSNIPATICGGASCDEICIALSFSTYSSFTARCVNGIIGLRWVTLDDDGNYRGALDDLPEGDAFGDVIYFDSTTHQFVEGPRSVPSRAISTFMGGR